MKRKILSLALIAALVLALSVSAFAEQSVPSGVAGDALPDSEQGTLVYDPKEIDAIADEVCADNFLENVGLLDDAAAQLESVIPADKKDKVKSIELDLVAAFNFTAAEGVDATKVTFTNVPSVKNGDAVIVLHFAASGWEVLPAEVTADGTVVVTNATGKWSPVAIVLAVVSYNSDGTTTPPPSTPVVTSPQTSDIG